MIIEKVELYAAHPKGARDLGGCEMFTSIEAAKTWIKQEADLTGYKYVITKGVVYFELEG